MKSSKNTIQIVSGSVAVLSMCGIMLNLQAENLRAQAGCYAPNGVWLEPCELPEDTSTTNPYDIPTTNVQEETNTTTNTVTETQPTVTAPTTATDTTMSEQEQEARELRQLDSQITTTSNAEERSRLRLEQLNRQYGITEQDMQNIGEHIEDLMSGEKQGCYLQDGSWTDDGINCAPDQFKFLRQEHQEQNAAVERRCFDKRGNVSDDRQACSSSLVNLKADQIKVLGLPKTVIAKRLSAKAELQVLSGMDKRYLGPQTISRVDKIKKSLSVGVTRLDDVLASSVFEFTASDRTLLQQHLSWLKSQQAIDLDKLPKTEQQQVAEKIKKILTTVAGHVTRQQRQLAQRAPQIADLVGRVDAVLAKITKALAILERESISVATSIEQDYSLAKAAMLLARQECRAGTKECEHVRDVIVSLEEIKEPLKKLIDSLDTAIQTEVEAVL